MLLVHKWGARPGASISPLKKKHGKNGRRRKPSVFKPNRALPLPPRWFLEASHATGDIPVFPEAASTVAGLRRSHAKK
jgi:hypothetical protein